MEIKSYAELEQLTPEQEAFKEAVKDLNYREFEDGWLPIVERLHQRLLKIYPEYRIMQIKEKFGGLRYYTDMCKAEYFEAFNDEIRKAEEECSRTCEICGEPGKAAKNERGWIQTVCEKHLEGRAYFQPRGPVLL